MSGHASELGIPRHGAAAPISRSRGEASPDRASSRHRRFHKPVVVQTGRLDRDRVIADTRDASEVLLRDWPSTNCPKRLRAMRACLEVIRSRKPPSHARTALVAAAREARVLIEA